MNQIENFSRTFENLLFEWVNLFIGIEFIQTENDQIFHDKCYTFSYLFMLMHIKFSAVPYIHCESIVDVLNKEYILSPDDPLNKSFNPIDHYIFVTMNIPRL